MPERIAGLIVMNTALGTGEGSLGQGFIDWRAYVKANPDLDVATRLFCKKQDLPILLLQLK